MPLVKVQSRGTQNVGGGRKNLIINGAMQVAQRATSVTDLGNSAGYKTVDRFKVNCDTGNATSGRFTMSQVTDIHDGFTNAIKLDCTTADTSIGSGELLALETMLEGQDLQHLKKGSSDAEKITISFYVKGNGNATYMLEVKDGDNDRLNHHQFAVTSSWNRISVTLVGDTTGALDNDNAKSLELRFWLHAGSDYTSGSYTANTWASQTHANRAVGISSFFSSTDNTFFITGLQMEVGEQATPFEHRLFGEELALCQRYFFRSGKGDSPYVALAQGWATSSINGIAHVAFPCEMRAEPSFSFLHLQASDDANAGLDVTACITNNATGNRMYGYLEWTVASGATQYRGYAIRGQNNSSAFIAYDAEL